MPSVIRTITSYIPDTMVTNHDLSKIVDTNDQWITERTGIKTRYIAKNEENSDLAAKVALKAIKKTNLQKEDIDCFILATCTPDQPNPATACIAAKKIGFKNIPVFDLNAMCTGFLYGLQVAQGLADSGIYKNILLVGSEKLSDIINWQDRSTCIIFGDGAGAAIISPASIAKGSQIIGTHISADGEQNHLLRVKGKISSTKPLYLEMHGGETFKYAITNLISSSKIILKQHNLTMEDVDWLVPHQANLRIIKAVAERCNIPMKKVASIIDCFGNTSAASIPMAIVHHEDKFKKGDLLLCPAFGGGLTYGASLIRW